MVNYRIGSLENQSMEALGEVAVNYRIGSLENCTEAVLHMYAVNYRIGSLEILGHKCKRRI